MVEAPLCLSLLGSLVCLLCCACPNGMAFRRVSIDLVFQEQSWFCGQNGHGLLTAIWNQHERCRRPRIARDLTSGGVEAQRNEHVVKRSSVRR